MDEKILFDPQNPNSQNQSQPQTSDPNPFVPPPPPSPIPSGAVPPLSAPIVTEPAPPKFIPTAGAPPIVEEEGFNIGRLLRIVIGIVVILVVVVLAILFVPKFLGKSNKNVTLSYWGLWEDEKVMQTVISDFEKQNPNIKVKYERQDIKQYREKLSTRIANNTGPDIFRFHNTWVPVLSSSLTPLPDDVITKKDFANNYYPTTGSDLVKNGAIYGIPLEIDTISMYINVELFDAAGASPPTTWEDFIRLSRQLTVKDEGGAIKTSGASLGTFDNITHAPDIISMLLFQNGADIYDLKTTQKQASDALSFYASFATGEASVWDNTLDPSVMSFAKGNLAMYFGYSWDYFTIKAINPEANFLIAPVPSLPGQNITTASYWVEGISSKSKNQDEAFIFMKYLAGPEVQKRLFSEASKTRLFGEPYSRRDLASLVKDNRYVAPYVAQAEKSRSSFFVDSTYDNAINSQMNAYLGNAVRAILNGTSAESAVETLSQGVSQVLSQYAGQTQTR